MNFYDTTYRADFYDVPMVERIPEVRPVYNCFFVVIKPGDYGGLIPKRLSCHLVIPQDKADAVSCSGATIERLEDFWLIEVKDQTRDQNFLFETPQMTGVVFLSCED